MCLGWKEDRQKLTDEIAELKSKVEKFEKLAAERLAKLIIAESKIPISEKCSNCDYCLRFANMALCTERDEQTGDDDHCRKWKTCGDTPPVEKARNLTSN
jgi:hypothetical protein